MDRAILLAAGGLWVLVAAVGLGVAVAGAEWIRGLLPPLSIGEATLARTVAALAGAALLLGLVHVAIGIALGRSRWAPSAGVLLSGVSVAGFVALLAAALTSAAAGSMALGASLGAAGAAAIVAIGYLLAGWALVRRLRS